MADIATVIAEWCQYCNPCWRSSQCKAEWTETDFPRGWHNEIMNSRYRKTLQIIEC